MYINIIYYYFCRYISILIKRNDCAYTSVVGTRVLIRLPAKMTFDPGVFRARNIRKPAAPRLCTRSPDINTIENHIIYQGDDVPRTGTILSNIIISIFILFFSAVLQKKKKISALYLRFGVREKIIYNNIPGV